MSVRPLKPSQINYLKKLAKTVISRQEFIEKYPEEYKISRRHKLLTHMFGHLPPKKRKYWSDEDLFMEAKKYTSRDGFSRSSAYSPALKRGILDSICSHMDKKHIEWNDDFKEFLKKEIAKCTTFREFYVKHKSHLTMIRYKKWESILKPLVKTKTQLTSVGEETLRLFLESLFFCQFKKSHPSWLINPITNRKLELDGYCEFLGIAFEHGSKFHDDSYSKKKDEIKITLCKKNNIKLLDLNEDFSLFYGQEKILKEKIRSELVRNKIKIPYSFIKTEIIWVFPDNAKLKYSNKEILKESKKYKTLREFSQNSSKMYSVARKRKLIPLIKAWLKSKPIKYTELDFVNAVKGFKSKREFRKKNKLMYSLLQRRGKIFFNRVTKNLD